MLPMFAKDKDTSDYITISYRKYQGSSALVPQRGASMPEWRAHLHPQDLRP